MSSDGASAPSRPNVVRLGSIVGLLAFGTIAAAWVIQWVGYAPCELCLKERIPYYAGVPLAGLVIWLAWTGRDSLLPAGFAGLALIFAAGMLLAAYHAGVEGGFWPGPASCTGSLEAPAAVDDFLHQLRTASVVRCDAAALHLFGLSLAAWDAIVCAVLASLAAWGALRVGRG